MIARPLLKMQILRCSSQRKGSTKKFVVDYLRDGTSYYSSDLNSSFFFLLLTTVKQIEVIEVTSAAIATTIVRYKIGAKIGAYYDTYLF